MSLFWGSRPSEKRDAMQALGRVGMAESAAIQTALEPEIAALRLDSVPVDALCLSMQSEPQAPFRIAARYPLSRD